MRGIRPITTDPRLRCVLAVIVITAGLGTERPQAQPPPAFSATCETVREEADRLDPAPDELVTIEVTGELLLAEFDGAISYMGLCSDPAPQVLCVTYRLDHYEVGDHVTVVGAYRRDGPNFITLDPCLHH